MAFRQDPPPANAGPDRDEADEPALGTDATSFAAPWDVGQPMW